MIRRNCSQYRWRGRLRHGLAADHSDGHAASQRAFLSLRRSRQPARYRSHSAYLITVSNWCPGSPRKMMEIVIFTTAESVNLGPLIRPPMS